MSTTANKLTYLENTKLAIKQALTDKGVTVSDSDTFRSYADKIDEIQIGGGGAQIFYTDEPEPTSTRYNKVINLIKKIDLSHLTEITLGHLFEYCGGLEEIIWPSNLREMLEAKAEIYTYYTFRGCTSLKSVDLSNFYVGDSQNMTYMFAECQFLTSLDLSSFDTSKVTDMAYMFYNCMSLTSLDLSSFDTSNVTYMYQPFGYCSKLTNVIWGNNWASNSAITSFDVSSCPLSHDSCLDLFNKLATKSSNATLKLSTTTKGYMSEEEIAIATNKGWTVS